MPIHDYLPYLFIAWTTYFILVVSPGPATLALAATSMTYGRTAGLMLALGVFTGSFTWACLASLGLAAILSTYAGLLTILKIVGGLYLLYLAWKSFRSAMQSDAMVAAVVKGESLSHRKRYFQGLGLHLTNPKAILGWISLLSLGLPPGAPTSVMFLFVAGCLAIGSTTFFSLALLFSTAPVRRGYSRARRYIEGFMGAFFAFAGFKMLMARV